MKIDPTRICFSLHAKRRMVERFPHLFAESTEQALHRIAELAPRAVVVCPAGKQRKILAVPVDDWTIYLIVTWRAGGMFVITCMTHAMVDDLIARMNSYLSDQRGRSKKLPGGKTKQRRSGRRSNRFRDWDGHQD